MTGLEFFTQIIVKASALLAAAFAVSWMLRSRAASLRHFMWTAGLAALLLLPVLTAVTPKWGLRAMPQSTTVITVRQVAGPISHAAAAAPSPLRPYWLLIAWSVGFLIAAVRFAMGAARTARMVRRAVPAAHTIGDVPVLESPEVPMPLAWGIRRPVVVLPVEARDWTEARLRTVLLHEWMHVERRDLLAQRIGQAVCCLYWFHPMAWLAARQLRKERERACDDAVLLRGIPAPDYASHLVDLVRVLAARGSEWAGAAGMAERSDLESRVRALLDRRRSRQPLSRRAALVVSAAAFAVLLPMAALTMYAQPAAGGLTGLVKDPSGARIPNCQVIAKNLDGSNQESAMTNPAGEYRFNAIPPGHYELSVRAPGFAILKLPIVVAAGQSTTVNANLDVGSVNQVVTVSGQKPAAGLNVPLRTTPRPQAAAPQRIRVGGNVQASKLLVQTHPIYPDDARAEGVEGIVTIRAIISKTGDLLHTEVVSTVDPRLAKAALDAVSLWRYTPTLLNGEPVETPVSIDLEFKLNQ